MRRRKRNNRNKTIVALVAIIAILTVVSLLLVILIAKENKPTEEKQTTALTEQITQDIETTASEEETPSEDWKLLLVNRLNLLPDGYTADIVEHSNGQYVDSRIVPELDELIAAAASDGVNIVVRSGYRSAEEQQELYTQRRANLISNGMSEAEADVEILNWVAYPGTSEHQTGLAVDINGDRVVTTDDEAYAWLAQNAYKYGFINRYPEDKTDITYVTNEPWHIRYVGKETASEIFQRQICLEEYLGRVDNQ